MSHLEYQTPFHPGPFASQQMQQHQQQHQQHPTQHHQQQQATQQQAYAQSPNPHQFNPSGTASNQPPLPASATQPQHQQPLPVSSSAAPQSQAFAPAPSYPGHNHSRPPPPQFHDGLMQQAPHFSPAASFAGGQQSPYTSAPFNQSVTATSTTPTPPLQQQQQQQAVRHSASPQQLNSPYAGPQHQQFQQPGQQQLQHQQQPPKQQTPPTRYPMAAPPLPQTPSAVQHAGSNAALSPQAPQSPGTQAREQKRVDMLLEINIDLLQEINSLQAQGRGGAMNPQHQQQLRQANMDDSMAAEEYIQCLRRVQANLAYLAPRADTQQAMKAPPGPAHMTPPAHMPQLQPKYEQLRELFPGWAGNDARMAQSAGSPRTNQMNSMNGMNSQTAQA